MLQQHVPGDAAAKAGCQRKAKRADDVVFVAKVLAGMERSTGAGNADAEKVEQGDQVPRMNDGGEGGHTRL